MIIIIIKILTTAIVITTTTSLSPPTLLKLHCPLKQLLHRIHDPIQLRQDLQPLPNPILLLPNRRPRTRMKHTLWQRTHIIPIWDMP